ncbi:hypothetical protein M674_08990 [Neisseria gonorrhoeae SK708]|nr:hypothetical protein M674_08990 [Neisseria gonorrhoeae SK708]
MVVEVACRRRNGIIAETAAQYRSQHLLHRRLAARTGNAEHKRVHIIAPRLRQRLQRGKRVIDFQRAAQSRAIFARNHNRRRARRQYASNKIMRVKPPARQCEKHIAFPNIAAVGYDARHGFVFRRHRKLEGLADEI